MANTRSIGGSLRCAKATCLCLHPQQPHASYVPFGPHVLQKRNTALHIAAEWNCNALRQLVKQPGVQLDARNGVSAMGAACVGAVLWCTSAALVPLWAAVSIQHGPFMCPTKRGPRACVDLWHSSCCLAPYALAHPRHPNLTRDACKASRPPRFECACADACRGA